MNDHQKDLLATLRAFKQMRDKRLWRDIAELARDAARPKCPALRVIKGGRDG